MQKNYYHNDKFVIEKKNQKKIISSEYINPNRKVDIFKLLNRVRLEKKIETKNNIIFYSLAVLMMIFFMALLTIF